MNFISRFTKLSVVALLAFSFVGCVCLQDRSNGNRIQVNTVTGAYAFCSEGVSLMGNGKITRKGNRIVLEDNRADRRVLVNGDLSTGKGSAAVQIVPGGKTYSISGVAFEGNCPVCGGIDMK